MGDAGALVDPAWNDPGERERRVTRDSGVGEEQSPRGGRTDRVPACGEEAETSPRPPQGRLRPGQLLRVGLEGVDVGQRSSWLE